MESGENLARVLAGVEHAAREGAAVVCLPELFRTRYPCQSEDPTRFGLAEPVPGPTSEALCKRARELGVAVVASLFERRAPGLYPRHQPVPEPGSQGQSLAHSFHQVETSLGGGGKMPGNIEEGRLVMVIDRCM